MAYPDPDKLLDIGHCVTPPANTVTIDSRYYCIDGWNPNTNLDGCIADFTSIHTPETSTTPSGIGKERYFFESSAIDRSFTANDYQSIYVDSLNWGVGPNIADKFRAIAGLFWVWNSDKNKIVYLNKPSGIADGSHAPFSPHAHSSPPEHALSSPFDLLIYNDFGATSAEIKIKPNDLTRTGESLNMTLDADGQAQFRALVSGLFSSIGVSNQISPGSSESGWFYDHTFSTTSPTDKEFLPASSERTDYYNINSTYNFYVPTYEHLLNVDKEIEEPILPSLYAILLEALRTRDNVNGVAATRKHVDHINLKGGIGLGVSKNSDMTNQAYFPNLLSVKVIQNTGISDSAIIWHDVNENTGLRYKGYTNLNTGVVDEGQLTENQKYYSMWAEAYPRVTDGDVAILNNQYSNIFISSSVVPDLPEYHTKKEAFPMFIGIEFTTPIDQHATLDLPEAMSGTLINCYTMRQVVNTTLAAGKQYIEFIAGDRDAATPMVDDTGPDARTRRFIKIDPALDDSITNYTGDMELSNAAIFGNVCSGTAPALIISQLSAFETNITAAETANQRTIKEVLEGKHCNTDILMYRIEKITKTAPRAEDPDAPTTDMGEAVQNIYLPNSNSINIHKYIDTQIKYGKEYTYKVYAWKVVYGMKYKYKTLQIYEASDYATVEVQYEPSTIFVEIPLFEKTTKVLDKPSLHPNVDIIPYNEIDNKVIINLQPNAGSAKLKPIVVEDSDQSENNAFLISQGLSTEDPKARLEYGSDDRVVQYRIYRIEKHPTSYSDFGNGLIRDIDSTIATSISINEKVTPNKQYWYIFRSIDNHGHLSYPSPIYQVELVHDLGIYSLISVVDLKNIGEANKAKTKSFKKLMHITPALDHVLLPTDTEDYFNTQHSPGSLPPAKTDIATDMKLGQLPADKPSLWGNKFKFRLTSKKTGRKIDINVRFKNKHKP